MNRWNLTGPPEPHPSVADRERRNARTFGSLTLVFALTVSVGAQDSYYVNSGANRQHDSDLGETDVDLFGSIPFSAYDDPAHPLHAEYGITELRRLLLQHFGNLWDLDDALLDASEGLRGLLPAVVEHDPETDVRDQKVWWDEDPEYLRVWKFRVNGAPLLVMHRNGVIPEPAHLLLINEPRHDSDFGNKTGIPGTYNTLDFDQAFKDPTWPWTVAESGAPNLIPSEQAVARGDLVAIVKENISAEFHIALQRTQDAERFLRTTFLANHFGEPVALGHSYLDGGSWGAQVSGMMALLQSAVYAGSLNAFIHDIGMALPGVGDFDRLEGQRRAAFGGLPPAQSYSDRLAASLQRLVDLLGTRFDHPDLEYGMEPWDLGSLAITRRAPEDLAIPLFPIFGEEDTVLNVHWQLDDGIDRPHYHLRLFRNLGHGGGYGVAEGINEFFLWTGDEWETMLASSTAGPNEVNSALVPTVAPPVDFEPYPEPYGHSLRPAACTKPCPLSSRLLVERKMDPNAKRGRALGQGCWPGHHDSMLASDFDGDGSLELVFGNLDGFLHVLELDESGAAPVLRAEYQSPPLAWGLWSRAGGEAGDPAWFGSQSGTVFELKAKSPDRYRTDLQPVIDPDNPGVYSGEIARLHRADFVPSKPGEELMLLNLHGDWVLLDAEGRFLDRLYRDHRGTGAGLSCVAEVVPGADSGTEVLVPALDGHLWAIAWSEGEQQLKKQDLTGFLGMALYRVEAAPLRDGGSPSHLLLFARDDGRPAGEEELVVLYDLEAGAIQGEPLISTAKMLRPSFAWIEPPAAGQGVFAIGGQRSLERVLVRDDTLECEDSTEMPNFDPEVEQDFPAEITSIASADTANGKRLFVAQSNGRIYALDEHLNFLRDAADLYGNDPDVPVDAVPCPWPSNHSLAHVDSVAVHQEPFDSHGKGGVASFYAAEYNQSMWIEGFQHKYRVVRAKLKKRNTRMDEVLNVTAPRISERTSMIRTLIVDDFVPDSDDEPEFYFLAESGTVLPGGGIPRQFCSRAVDPLLFPTALGGYVFEFRSIIDYAVLSDFHVPRTPGFFDAGGEDWVFPVVGNERITGQISSMQSGVVPEMAGTGMTRAELLDPAGDGSTLVECVVAGTVGGFVYVIAPGDADPESKELPSRLLYASDDLGWRPIGMDTADLDGDGEDEIVVGTWLDTGTAHDWMDRQEDRNRGHLLVLDPVPDGNGGVGRLEVIADLDFDEVAGVGPRSGIGSGVFGVALDDVDGDGQHEIWCGDASGRIYLFQRRDGVWQGVYRSAMLGVYAGLYNGIFPVKDADGRTVKLVVRTAGYVRHFDVDPGEL